MPVPAAQALVPRTYTCVCVALLCMAQLEGRAEDAVPRSCGSTLGSWMGNPAGRAASASQAAQVAQGIEGLRRCNTAGSSEGGPPQQHGHNGSNTNNGQLPSSRLRAAHASGPLPASPPGLLGAGASAAASAMAAAALPPQQAHSTSKSTALDRYASRLTGAATFRIGMGMGLPMGCLAGAPPEGAHPGGGFLHMDRLPPTPERQSGARASAGQLDFPHPHQLHDGLVGGPGHGSPGLAAAAGHCSASGAGVGAGGGGGPHSAGSVGAAANGGQAGGGRQAYTSRPSRLNFSHIWGGGSGFGGGGDKGGGAGRQPNDAAASAPLLCVAYSSIGGAPQKVGSREGQAGMNIAEETPACRALMGHSIWKGRAGRSWAA